MEKTGNKMNNDENKIPNSNTNNNNTNQLPLPVINNSIDSDLNDLNISR